MSELDSVSTWLRAALGTAVPDVFKLEQRAFEQVQQPRGIGRRAFLQSMTVVAAGLAVDPDQLIWTPTKRKNIILPVASEQVVAVATHHGTRYYMLLELPITKLSTQRIKRHLFFDSGWRLLHVVERRGGDGPLIVAPMVAAEQAMHLMALTGKTPIELGQMACQKHHGIYDDTTSGPDGWRGRDGFDGMVARGHDGLKFTVTEVAERIPYTQKLASAPNPTDPWVEVAPQQFRDLTPEETVRLVHDSAQQTRIPRNPRRRHYRAPSIRLT